MLYNSPNAAQLSPKTHTLARTRAQRARVWTALALPRPHRSTSMLLASSAAIRFATLSRLSFLSLLTSTSVLFRPPTALTNPTFRPAKLTDS